MELNPTITELQLGVHSSWKKGIFCFIAVSGFTKHINLELIILISRDLFVDTLIKIYQQNIL